MLTRLTRPLVRRGLARVTAFAAYAALAFLAALAFVPTSVGQDLGALGGASDEDFGSVPDYVEVRAYLDRDAYHPGDTARVAIEFRIDSRVHVNGHVPSFDYLVATDVTWDSVPAGLELSALDWPKPKMAAFEFTDGEKIAVYEGIQRAFFTVPVPAGAPGGSIKLTGTFKAQGCTHATCYAPQKDPVKVTLRVVPDDEETQPVNESKFAPKQADGSAPPAGPSAGPSGGGAAVASAGAGPAPPVGAEGEPTALDCDVEAARTLDAKTPIWFVFALSFGAGLLLTLTPCVLPLVPITIGFFARQQSTSGSKLALASLYVLGLATVYSILGTFAALTGSLFGAALQNPAVLIVIALILLALALSMFGILPDLQLPSSLSSKIGRGRTGHVGAYAMGAAMGLIAAPCVGPLVVTLLTYVADLGSRMPKAPAAALGGALFFVLALGLGMPFFLVGMGIASIRPGAWMVTVKKVFGFAILGVVLWFVRPLTGDLVFQVGLVLVLLGAAAFLIHHAGGVSTSKGRGLVRVGAALSVVAAIVLGVVFFAPKPPPAAARFEPYSQARLAAARAAGRPVVIDFMAEWCTVCKEIEHRVFPDPVVQAAFDERRFVLLQADLTNESDPVVQRLRRDYQVSGLPAIVFLDPSGDEMRDLRLTGYEKPADFAERLRCVAESEQARHDS